MLEINPCCLEETVGRNMNDKGVFGEVLDGNEEHVSGHVTGRKGFFVIEW